MGGRPPMPAQMIQVDRDEMLSPKNEAEKTFESS